MAGVKAKIVTAAAVAVVGVGSVVTYNAVKNEPASPSRPAATSPARQAAPARTTGGRRPAPRPAAVSRPVEQIPAQAEPADATVEEATALNDEQPVGGYTTRTTAPTGAAAPRTAVGPRSAGGYGMGGYGGGYGGAVGGAYRTTRVQRPASKISAEDPNSAGKVAPAPTQRPERGE